ncbi:MAG TPA: sensor histidine kinase [Ginsengibacter sp.]|nr:sensor histidine kinase [Ginsengibacter sp.]
MIKDKYLRLLFIPLLGIIIPFFSGIISYNRYSILELIAINLYFILLSYCIWTGATWLHRKTRFISKSFNNPIVKLFSVSLLGGLFGAAISGIFSIAWYKISKESFSWLPVSRCVAFSSLAVLLFTLLYEILFLSTQRVLYTKIVDQLDWERSKAEMSVLKNELEPHFIFNSLNTLSWLILNDPETAHQFNSKLASVYKYFLINKDRELITLQGELEFIENYFFVLQVRHDNKLHLSTDLSNYHEGTLMILPYALQILVENAVKHNEFSDADPLYIKVVLNGEYIQIKNNKKPKPYLVNSTGIGLRNLSSRYRLVCNKDIIIEATDNEFTVKLPLIKSNL